MGKGTIISETGGGLYSIDVEFDTTVAETRVAKLQAILVTIQAAIDAGPEPVKLSVLELRKTALTKEIARIQAAADMSRHVSAWCADLTEGLTGTVGTIEIGTEAQHGVNIQPGHENNQVYNADRDGIETPFLTLHVADAMRNFAVIPGIQKHRPTYRYAVISDLDTDNNTCTVVFETATSSIQDLNINHVPSITDVPIEYMTCDAAAFEDGDTVVVKFEPYNTTGQAKVIGFKESPKSCETYIKLESINGVTDFDPTKYRIMLTQPIPETISNWKGTYQEDYTDLGVVALDANGVGVFKSEKSIDKNKPIHVWLKNDNLFQYFTEDWRGNFPRYGVYQNEDDGAFYWFFSADPERDRFILDQVWGHRQPDLDYSTIEHSSFIKADGETVSGRALSFTGVIGLQVSWYRISETDIPCESNLNDSFHFWDYDGEEDKFAGKISGPNFKSYWGNPPFGQGDDIDVHFICRANWQYAQCVPFAWDSEQAQYFNSYGAATQEEKKDLFCPAILMDRDGTGIDGSYLSDGMFIDWQYDYDAQVVYWWWQSVGGANPGAKCCETAHCEGVYSAVVEEEMVATLHEFIQGEL